MSNHRGKRHNELTLHDTKMPPELRPLVSIAMPIYNCEQTLGTAVRSILRQSYQHWELLLLDDGSTDQTMEIALSFSDPRIRFLADGKHRGLVSRLNQAIDLSNGTYVARMDGDDVSYPERLALQVEYLEQHPDVDLLGGGILVFGQDGQVLGTHELSITHKGICRRPWGGFQFAHPTWMGRTRWFRKHPYRAEAVRCEDQDLLFRTYRSSRFAALPEIVLGYREQELSITKILTGRRSFVRSVLRETTQRREYAIAFAALVEQTGKSFVDCVAVGTGLNYRILRHRALPVGEAEQKRWTRVWNEVHREAAVTDANRLESVEIRSSGATVS